MTQLTIAQMKDLIEKLEQAKALDERIPQAYTDRLERANELLGELKKIKAIDWDSITTPEQIDLAEGAIHRKLELKNEIEKHFAACGLTSPGERQVHSGRGRRRQTNRNTAQIEYDKAIREITRAKKAELGINPRGTLSQENQARLETAVEKEIKKLKLAAPKA